MEKEELKQAAANYFIGKWISGDYPESTIIEDALWKQAEHLNMVDEISSMEDEIASISGATKVSSNMSKVVSERKSSSAGYPESRDPEAVAKAVEENAPFVTAPGSDISRYLKKVKNQGVFRTILQIVAYLGVAISYILSELGVV